jgi:hypothetical protein
MGRRYESAEWLDFVFDTNLDVDDEQSWAYEICQEFGVDADDIDFSYFSFSDCPSLAKMANDLGEIAIEVFDFFDGIAIIGHQYGSVLSPDAYVLNVSELSEKDPDFDPLDTNWMAYEAYQTITGAGVGYWEHMPSEASKFLASTIEKKFIAKYQSSVELVIDPEAYVCLLDWVREQSRE